jgi:outer membrane protein assembly factor BamE (lipoprotein component of BamABCDE complex)
MTPASMRFLLLVLLVAVLVAASGWFAPAGAQAKRPGAAASGAVAERAAVDLRQGMTLAEVQQLLGKPWRTALTNDGSLGRLRWTYTWPSSASASERNLNVEFAAKAPEQWTVSGWSWSTY